MSKALIAAVLLALGVVSLLEGTNAMVVPPSDLQPALATPAAVETVALRKDRTVTRHVLVRHRGTHVRTRHVTSGHRRVAVRTFILLSTLFLKCWSALQQRLGILGVPTLVSWDDPNNSPCGRRLAFCV